MSDNDLRDRIAKAISRAHEAWWNDEDNFLDMPGYEAQAVIDDLDLTVETHTLGGQRADGAPYTHSHIIGRWEKQ